MPIDKVMLNIEIDSVTVLTHTGTDTIMIKPKNLGTPYPELKFEAILKIEARRGYGREYCLSVGIPAGLITVIKV